MDNIIPGFKKEDISFKEMIKAYRKITKFKYGQIEDKEKAYITYNKKDKSVKLEKLAAVYHPIIQDREEYICFTSEEKIKSYNEGHYKDKFNSLLNTYFFLVNGIDCYLDNEEKRNELFENIKIMRNNIDEILLTDENSEYTIQTVVEKLEESTNYNSKSSMEDTRECLVYYKALGAIVDSKLNAINKSLINMVNSKNR